MYFTQSVLENRVPGECFLLPRNSRSGSSRFKRLKTCFSPIELPLILLEMMTDFENRPEDVGKILIKARNLHKTRYQLSIDCKLQV